MRLPLTGSRPGAPISNLLHVYEIRPREDKRGFDLISDALPFGGLWYLAVRDAIEYAQHNSRAHDAVINVYDAAGKLVEVRRHKGDFKEP
jgi:hypothetical protein